MDQKKKANNGESVYQTAAERRDSYEEPTEVSFRDHQKKSRES